MMILGFFIGAITMYAIIGFAIFLSKTITIIDLWWAENAERWESLRQILLKEKELM